MSDFRKLSDTVFASPQIELHDINMAHDAGVTLIINNRPDGEDADALQGLDVEAAADAAGLDYTAIPISHSGFSQAQVDRMIEALQSADGKVLAYCRSGTRSTFLWALAQAKMGADPDEIIGAAGAAGYDITPIRPQLDILAAQAKA